MNKYFLINLRNVFTQPVCVPSGVLQGSILTPALFLRYINGTSQDVKYNLFRYADDACLIIK